MKCSKRLHDFLFGASIPPGGVADIPQKAREVQHQQRNIAMHMRQMARTIERDANDLLELLARDIRRGERADRNAAD